MSLFDLPTIGGPPGPQTPRRGRPRGARNRRSSDLGKYVAARFGGMTPGQQAAELCMITARELREVKAEAKQLGVPPMVLAMGRRAQVLALALDCDRRDAMAILIKAQAELMPYVHQKLPQAPDNPKDRGRALVLGVPDAGFNPGSAPALPAPLPVGESVENAGLFDGVPEAVSPPQSHDDA